MTSTDIATIRTLLGSNSLSDLMMAAQQQNADLAAASEYVAIGSMAPTIDPSGWAALKTFLTDGASAGDIQTTYATARTALGANDSVAFSKAMMILFKACRTVFI